MAKITFLTLLFNIILEGLAGTIRQENKRYTDWKGRNKMFLITEYMAVYEKIPKIQHKNLCK